MNVGEGHSHTPAKHSALHNTSARWARTNKKRCKKQERERWKPPTSVSSSLLLLLFRFFSGVSLGVWLLPRVRVVAWGKRAGGGEGVARL
jgi:hypothetical protein